MCCLVILLPQITPTHAHVPLKQLLPDTLQRHLAASKTNFKKAHVITGLSIKSTTHSNIWIITYCAKKLLKNQCKESAAWEKHTPYGRLHPTTERSLFTHALPYLSPGKADVMTPSRPWHSGKWLKCSLTVIRPGDEICHTPLLCPHGKGREIWRPGRINTHTLAQGLANDHLAPPATNNMRCRLFLAR